MIRVGVIGTGVMGAYHAHLLNDTIAGAALAGTFDIDVGRAAEVAGQAPGARAFADPQELITADDVDAVLIASLDPTHEEFVLACLGAGKPVLCEKPLAPTVEGCQRILDAEAALGHRLINVGFMRRHDPGYVAVKTALHSGEVGRPLIVHNVHRNPTNRPGIPSTMLISGTAVHEIDILRWLLTDEVTAVTVHRPRSAPAAGDTIDPMLLVLEMTSGVLADIEVFTNASYGYEVRCEVVGETGILTLDPRDAVTTRVAGTMQQAIPGDWRPRFAEAYRIELQEWVHALETRQPSRGATAADGLMAARVVEAGIAALATGARTEVSA
jgi:myo-inositol 2-dehydrogenase/D-chiro-inositol 1-dehydrogenase